MACPRRYCQWSSDQRGIAQGDDQLRQVRLQRRGAGLVPLVKDKRVVLELPRIGVAQDDIAQRAMLDLVQCRCIEALVLVPEPVAVTHSLELVGDDGGEGLADEGARCDVLRQAASPEIDRIDRAKGLL